MTKNKKKILNVIAVVFTLILVFFAIKYIIVIINERNSAIEVLDNTNDMLRDSNIKTQELMDEFLENIEE